MRNSVIFLGFILILVIFLFQKYATFYGVVVDARDGKPLKDSHIYVEGTNIGTISNEKGEFALPVPFRHKERQLIVSYLSYTTYVQKISTIEKPEMRIALDQTAIPLDDVIVKFDVSPSKNQNIKLQIEP
ncbi:MAG: carboxypeptidase-like regulatory domain-containing protein [Cyclobacteriaceae bacterium]|nr:carboxypeptidase-like regulatory domain-containing protein [Cyclobacteriaceae bacterium]